MDHLEAIELMEIAAAEPDGLERLAAGDTPESAALVGHMAGCPTCMVEFATLRRLADVVRGTLGDEPEPELRARTLAYVAAMGRERAAPAVEAGAAARPEPAEPVWTGARAEPLPVASATAASTLAYRGSGWRPGWLAIAAAVVVAFVAGGLAVGLAQQRALDQGASASYSLARVNEEALRIGAAPDAVTVALSDPSGGSALGSLVFSGADGELAVMASGLPAPEPGWEYRCWVETDGLRVVIGRMTLAEGLAYWAGPSDELGAAAAGSVFGVSLVASDAAGGGQPVLLGQVGGGSS